MRLVGPNSFGLLTTADDQRLNASLAPYLPIRGGLGLFCQSGAMAVSLLASVDRRGIGISSFLSAGNRADVSRSEEHTSELQSRGHLVCRLLLEKKQQDVWP